MNDHARKERNDGQRDASIRRRMLQMLELHLDQGDGWFTGRGMFDIMQMSRALTLCPDGDDHCLTLLRGLTLSSLAEQREERDYPSDPLGLDTLAFRITSRGIALLAQSIEPDPLVADPRLKRPQ